MPKSNVHIGLLSDNHGHWDDRISHHLSDCDEIWHAGDLGTLQVVDEVKRLAKIEARIVFGNIDDSTIRSEVKESLKWEIQGLTFFMTHIGGRPGRYAKGIRRLLEEHRPDVFICGHSHLLRVEKDLSFGGIYCNPGAAGYHGFHQKRTLIKFQIQDGAVCNMKVIELGNRIKKAITK